MIGFEETYWPLERSRPKHVDFLSCFSTFELARPAQLSQLSQLSRLRHLRRLSQLGQLSSASSGTVWSKKIEKVNDSDGAYVRFGSGPPVSRRRDESRCHQVCIFIDQSAARTSCGRTVGALIQHRENPYAASSVWGILWYVAGLRSSRQ